MAPSTTQETSRSTPEFSQLKSLGLTTVSIDADGKFSLADENESSKSLHLYWFSRPTVGNCLFAALSDQVYGHTGRAGHVRDTVVQHLRENPDNYKPFINYDGDRRGTRTRTRGRHSPTTEAPEDVEEKIGAAWEQYLASMSELGTWGDNLEIRAFACAFGRTVRVHRGSEHQDIVADKVKNMMVQIAYHVSHTLLSPIQDLIKKQEWRHYSSVRSTEKRPKLTLTFKKRHETIESARESSYATSVSSPSSPSPSSTSSVTQDLDSTDDRPDQAPVCHERPVARKNRDKFIVDNAASFSSNGSNKRILEDLDNEDIRSSKRPRS